MKYAQSTAYGLDFLIVSVIDWQAVPVEAHAA